MNTLIIDTGCANLASVQYALERLGYRPRVSTDPAAIRAALQNARASILIHGHTHRPAVHRLDDGDTVYVLGDWRPHGEILRYADGACTLINSAEIIHALDNAGA